MDTKKLITILERELGTVKSNNLVDKVRDEIIKRLKAHDMLRVSHRVLGKDLKEFMEFIEEIR